MKTELSPHVQAELRRALRHLEEQAPPAPELPGLQLEEPSQRRWSPARVVVAGFVVALVLVAPALFIVRGGEPSSTQLTSSTAATSTVEATTTTDGPVSQAALDYWKLEGTLESVGSEDGWLCPAGAAEGYTGVVAESDMAPDLKLAAPGLQLVDVYNRSDGPTCHQPPMLVMLAPTDQAAGIDAVAGVTVWPKLTIFEDTCPPDTCSYEGQVEVPTINGQPARLQYSSETGHYDIWWVDKSGVPLYAETSGLDKQHVLQVVNAIEVDPVTHRATVDEAALGNLVVEVDQASVGVWDTGQWRGVTYDTDAGKISLWTTHDASFSPIARYATFVSDLSLVETGDTQAVWTPEGDRYLDFINDDGVKVSISDAMTIEDAIAFAEQLQ